MQPVNFTATKSIVFMVIVNYSHRCSLHLVLFLYHIANTAHRN